MYTAKTARSLNAVILLLTATLSLPWLNGCQSQQVFQQRFLQFGTIIDISLVSTDRQQAEQVFDEIAQLLETRQHEWHGWEKGTLSQFNQALTQPTQEGVPIPETLQQLVRESKKYYTLSEGLFNPALGRLIAAWGFHASSDPDFETIQLIKQNLPGMDDLRISQQRAYSTNPHLQLDFGAIAKGLGVKQIAELVRLHQIRNFIINAGGDIFAQGKNPHRDWRIALQNPFGDGVLGSLSTSEAISVFTSGNYRRYYMDSNNKKRHHIIDPVTGEPSTNISAVTLMHADPVIADIAATTLMLTQPAQLKKMATRLGIQDFLAITEQHKLFISQSMLNKIQWTQPEDLELHIL